MLKYCAMISGVGPGRSPPNENISPTFERRSHITITAGSPDKVTKNSFSIKSEENLLKTSS